MAYGKITDKQREILEYIKNEILNRGFPPAVREICEAVNLKSSLLFMHTWRVWKRMAISDVILPNREQLRSWMTTLTWCAERW